jgi:murein DD-endopeptidase MepM/ murein hydrolase activator NlpD
LNFVFHSVRIKIPIDNTGRALFSRKAPHKVPHNPRRRRIALTLAVIVSGIFVVLNWPLLASGADRVASKVVLYYHVAQLYTKDPDSRLSMPLLLVQKGEIANTWHAPRGSNRLHEGQDIFAPQGTPIYSATSGYVLNIGENGLGGQTVSVVGAGGRVYYYAHLNAYSPTLREGDRVGTKTVLGFVGTTGNAAGTPPHLHFGVYTPQGAINPLPLLADRPKPPPLQTKPTASKKKPKPRKQR